MTRVEHKPADPVSFLALVPAKAIDHPAAVAKKAQEQSTTALVNFAAAAEDSGRMLDAIVENTSAKNIELSMKTLAALRANADAEFSHLKALLGAKLPSEVIELQSSFLRKRVEMWVEQGQGVPGTHH
ncbi:phasin family protein [Mesorhizobium ciceri]|uniref:phasin family protein n=1 Tax=Mesorhizobium TaxID=68287 RepID=UPI0004B30E56|nr:phasin family protein [Mesorhizobium ciceri]